MFDPSVYLICWGKTDKEEWLGQLCSGGSLVRLQRSWQENNKSRENK